MSKPKHPLDMAFKRKAELQFVRGSSTIKHRIRAKLHLTCEEYIFLDFFKNWQDVKYELPTFHIIWKNLGITYQELQPIIESLKKKQFLYKDRRTGIVTTSIIWDNEFNTENKFELLWELSRYGNKENAKIAYLKTMKIIGHDKLMGYYKKYLKYCEDSGQNKMHASTFLNPKTKQWKNEIQEVKGKEETNPKVYPHAF